MRVGKAERDLSLRERIRRLEDSGLIEPTRGRVRRLPANSILGFARMCETDTRDEITRGKASGFLDWRVSGRRPADVQPLPPGL